jgi:hypothetical protein
MRRRLGLVEVLQSAKSGLRKSSLNEHGKKKLGLIANVLISDFDDAEALGQSSNPVETWEGIDAHGLDPVKLDTLQVLAYEECGADASMGHSIY